MGALVCVCAIPRVCIDSPPARERKALKHKSNAFFIPLRVLPLLKCKYEAEAQSMEGLYTLNHFIRYHSQQSVAS